VGIWGRTNHLGITSLPLGVSCPAEAGVIVLRFTTDLIPLLH